jgi:phosphoglycerate dehydrogenase-like enzyme
MDHRQRSDPGDRVQVMVTIDLAGELMEEIVAMSPRLAVRHIVCASPRAVNAALDGRVEVIYARELPDDLTRAPALRWVQTHSAGVDHLRGHPLFSSDVMVTTTSGAHAVPGAEYVIGAMIGMARGFPALARDQERREWIRAHSPEHELRDMTVLILGYGSIGREIARLASTFGMRIIALKRNSEQKRDLGFSLPGTGDPDGALPERFIEPGALYQVLPAADFVVSTLPLTPDTERFLSAQQFRAMKPSAILVNISRGGVCDEPALIRALAENWIGGAILDVFAEEPLPADSPFYDLPNVFLTPHISASRQNPHYDRRTNAIFIENLRRYLQGQPLVNLVDKEAGY